MSLEIIFVSATTIKRQHQSSKACVVRLHEVATELWGVNTKISMCEITVLDPFHTEKCKRAFFKGIFAECSPGFQNPFSESSLFHEMVGVNKKCSPCEENFVGVKFFYLVWKKIGRCESTNCRCEWNFVGVKQIYTVWNSFFHTTWCENIIFGCEKGLIFWKFCFHTMWC